MNATCTTGLVAATRGLGKPQAVLPTYVKLAQNVEFWLDISLGETTIAKRMAR
jgi:hypothetical protein